MHIVGYDTPNGPMDEYCTREWLAGLLNMTMQEAHDATIPELVKSAGVVDVHPVYATDLACRLCEDGEDHADDGSECEDERCSQCEDAL